MYKLTITNLLTDSTIGIKCSDKEEAEMKFEIICAEEFDCDVEIVLTENNRSIDSKTKRLS